jgi:hypothetical protein
MNLPHRTKLYLQLVNIRKPNPSSDANSHSAIQEILHLQSNTKICYGVYKSLSLAPILNEVNVHTTISWLIFPSKLGLRLLGDPFSSGFTSKQNCCVHLSCLSCMLHAPPNLIILINVISKLLC